MSGNAVTYVSLAQHFANTDSSSTKRSLAVRTHLCYF